MSKEDRLMSMVTTETLGIGYVLGLLLDSHPATATDAKDMLQALLKTLEDRHPGNVFDQEIGQVASTLIQGIETYLREKHPT